jgi:predicted nucleotidyltransferase
VDLSQSIAHLDLEDAVPGLAETIARSNQTIDRMRQDLATAADAGAMDVVAFGSLARREYTQASDIDYLVLVDSTPEAPAAPRDLLQMVKACLSKEADANGAAPKDPGASGLFGKAVGTFDIINQVGLLGDTNFTHTARMEILQESVSLLNTELHAKILRRTIGRYISLFSVPPSRPPRFLLNDMVRYWRQITVDYQAKAPTATDEPKAVLRYLKLGITRKNLAASSILPLLAVRDDSVPWDDYLQFLYALPPLARLATVTKDAPNDVKDAVRTVFKAVDLFVQRTDDSDKRRKLERITWDARKEDETFMELRAAADDLQKAFEHIFLDWRGAANNTRRYLLL